MQPEERNLAYLWDMRKHAREITGIIKDVPYETFIDNIMIRYAIERLLMIIGEAANHVSGEFQEKHPEIEWFQIIGMRNILAHEYGEIKNDRVYLAATNSIPELLKNLEPLLPE
jgi:uncharacterized protein with HEPN domain